MDDPKSEADMIKTAEKLFEQKNYSEALPLYSQLLSLHSDDANYNYKYGTCLLYASADKEESLKHLKYAVTKSGVDPMAFYYLGRSYQLNYFFKEAIKSYTDFKLKAPVKVSKEYDVTQLIKQCEEGKSVIQDVQLIHVLSKKEASKAEFFRAYDLGQFDRKIIVKPDDFKTKLDKKLNENSIIVHNPTVEEVYFSSYGEKGEAGRDIYKVVLFADKTKSTPINLGPMINTSLDEDYPYLHPNGRILYFASKGHNSLGGYDIFRSELDTNTKLWGAPVNLGFAVNSPDDDLLYVTDMYENVAYFASSRSSAKDEITVYKIVPNKEHIESTIIRGELTAEGNKQKNATITVTDVELGAVVGVYKSNEKSGAYTMTLQSNKKYQFKVVAVGYAPHEEFVSLPTKKIAPIVKQKIELKKSPSETMVLNNVMQATIDEVAFNEVYKKSASLDVNAVKDVGFNSAPIPPKTEIKNQTVVSSGINSTNTIVTPPVGVENKEMNNEEMVQEAANDAADLEKEYYQLKDEAEAAEYVSNLKKDDIEQEKQDVVELTRKLNQTQNAEEKKKIQIQIDEKVKGMRRMAREEAITDLYADQKKEELKNKKEEADAAKSYASAIKEALNSKNNTQAITKLEAERKKLDEIQERNESNGEVSLEKIALVSKQSKDAEIKQMELTIQKTDESIKTIENDQKNLKKQIDGTKSQQIKDELKLQQDELKEELAARQADKTIAEAQLAAIKADGGDVVADNQVVSNLQQQVNTAKTQDVAALEKERLEQQKAEKLKQQQDQQKNLQNSVAQQPNTKEGVNTKIAIIDSASKAESPAEKYNDELKKAKMSMDMLASLKQEQTILEKAMTSATSPNAKAQAQKNIDDLKVQQEKKKEEITLHLSNANKIKDNEKLTNDQIAAAPNKVDAKTIAEIDSYTKSTATVAIVETTTPNTTNPNNTVTTTNTTNAQVNPNNTNTTTNTNTVVSNGTNTQVNSTNSATNPTTTNISTNNTSNPVVSVDTSKNKSVFTPEFKAEKASEEQISQAALTAFGIKTSTKVEYTSIVVVTANRDNARQSENEALNLYSSAEQKRNEALKTNDVATKKKLNKEIEELDKQSQEKQLVASENYFYANRAEYDYNQSLINKAIDEGKLTVDPQELSSTENKWLQALLVREKNKTAKDFKAKVTNINEAYQKETEVIAKQHEILKRMKEADLLALKNQGATTVAVNPNTMVSAVDTSKKTSTNPKADLASTISSAYGVKQNPDYTYAKDESVQIIANEVNVLQTDAAKYYEEAQELKKKASDTKKKSEIKKFNKEANKKTKFGRLKMKQAMVKQGELNEAENKANKLKVQQAIEKNGLKLTDKQNKELKAAQDDFDKAKEIREKAKKTKSFAGQTDLNNQAFALENKALETQKKIIESKPDVIPSAVKVSKEDSVKAKNVAINTELKNDQLLIENNQKKIDAIKKETLSPAQKTEFEKLQKEVNDLLTKSKEKEKEAATINDPILATSTLNYAMELKKQAEKKQEQMIAIKDIPATTNVVVTNPVNANTATATNTATTTITPAAASKQYNDLLAEAKKMENEIAKEVEKYTQLKKDAKSYQLQSEQALAKGNVAEAEKLKKLADQKEEQALQSSQLIDNSRAEADAKRKEAKLFAESLNPQLAAEVKNKSNDKNTTTDTFANYKDNTQKEVAKVTVPVTTAPANTNPVTTNPNQNTNNGVTKIDVNNAPLFGSTSQEPQAAVLKDQFEIKGNAEYNENKPIPLDAPLPEGLVYTVQVGAFRNPIPQDLFKGISPLFGEKTPMGFIRYTAGTFRSFKAAAIAKDKIRQMGYPDAFVVPYYNGKRISMDQADQVTAKASQQQQNALQVIEAREVETINKVEVKNPVNIANTVTAAEAGENKANSESIKASDKLFYTVQIGVLSRPIKKGSIYDRQPLNEEMTANGLYRYSVGKYDDLNSANAKKAEINASGIPDAFVTVYRNGQRITVNEAQANLAATTNTNVATNAATPAAGAIVFKVQVGAFAKEVPVETTTQFFNLPAKVEYYKDAAGITIFTIGNFTSVEEARKLKDQVTASGLKDAFLVAYQGKDKISVDKALELLKK